jgi:outer membrane protein assembly factor BamE
MLKNILSGHVFAAAAFKYFQNAHARVGDFQAGAFKVVRFHRCSAFLVSDGLIIARFRVFVYKRMRLLILPALLLLSSCGLIYKQTIAQGNLLDQASIDQLNPGMSKRQVALILGTPTVQSPFEQDRWDYIYSYKTDGKAAEIKSVTLTFDDGQLAQISGDFKPGGQASVVKPEDALIEATREYQRELKAAEREREKSQDEATRDEAAQD